MNHALVERRIRCPFCDEPQIILLDPSAGEQEYIEDCQICCQPLLIRVSADDGVLFGVDVDRAD